MKDLLKARFYYEEEPGKAGDPPPADPPQPKNDPLSDPPVDPNKPPESVPYSRFKEVNDNYVTLKKKLEKIEQDQEDEKKKKLTEKEDYKTLWEQEQAKNKAIESKLLRLKVAQETGLPAEFAERLQGETEQELKADAEKLLAFVDTSKGSLGVPPRKNGGQSTKLDIANMTPEEIRKKSKELVEQAASELKTN